MLAGGLGWADPADLDGLREALELADPEGRLAPVGMSQVEIGHQALGLLPEIVSEFTGGPSVVLVVDATPMRRGAEDLKAGVERLLAGRFEVRRATIGDGAPHADEATLDETLPDCAAMLAAIEASTGVRAEAVVGKPSRHMARAVLDRLGAPARDTLLVGDRLATDIRMANESGISSALVLTGATTLEEAMSSGDRPRYLIENLGELLAGSG